MCELSIKLKFSLDAAVSRSFFELVLWMNKLKALHREAVSWKFLFENQKVNPLKQFA